VQRNKKEGMIPSRQNGKDLQQRNFEMSSVSDTFWAIEDVIHLVNYILIKYKRVYVSGLLIS